VVRRGCCCFAANDRAVLVFGQRHDVDEPPRAPRKSRRRRDRNVLAKTKERGDGAEGCQMSEKMATVPLLPLSGRANALRRTARARSPRSPAPRGGAGRTQSAPPTPRAAPRASSAASSLLRMSSERRARKTGGSAPDRPVQDPCADAAARNEARRMRRPPRSKTTPSGRRKASLDGRRPPSPQAPSRLLQVGCFPVGASLPLFSCDNSLSKMAAATATTKKRRLRAACRRERRGGDRYAPGAAAWVGTLAPSTGRQERAKTNDAIGPMASLPAGSRRGSSSRSEGSAAGGAVAFDTPPSW
jgi:hypothetical protein